jgi:hypothetical protein
VARYPAVVRGGTVAQSLCTTSTMPYRPTVSELAPATANGSAVAGALVKNWPNRCWLGGPK